MTNNARRLPAEFGPDTRFELAPVFAAPFRAFEDDELERLKGRLLAERLEEAWDPRALSFLRRAANDAAAVAWATPYPLLVFPGLFEEKAQEALLQAERQEMVLRRSRELLAV